MGLAVGLLGVLFLIAALVVWQHAPKVPESRVYGIEDAVQFVMERLDSEARGRIGESGARRIIEWEVFYLQGLAQDKRRRPVETVAGPYAPAIEYIKDRIDDVVGQDYPEADIERVLELEVDYLASIGAIGTRVEDEA